MNAPSSSSSFVAAAVTTTTVEAASQYCYGEDAVDREKNHDEEIILQTVIRKCHTAMKIDHIRFVLAQIHPMKTMSQTPCFDIEYWRS